MKQIKDKHLKVLTYILIIVMCFASIILPNSLLFAADTSSDSEEDSWILDTETTFDNYLVTATEIETTLYRKKADETKNDPLAYNLFLSLLALENLGSTQKVVISNETAELSKQEGVYNIRLEAGEKYEVEFLIYALLYYDSKAAANALVKNLATSAEDFTELANSRLRSLGMDISYIDVEADKFSLYTNLDDFELLLRAANNNKVISNIFHNRNEIYLAEDGTTEYLRNSMNYAWTVTNEEINAALVASNDHVISVCYEVSGEDYSIFILQSINANEISHEDYVNLKSQFILEAYRLSQKIFDSYEKTVLVQNGDEFKNIVLDNGVSIGLIYLNTVYFLKPKYVEEVKPEITMQLKDNITLPIQYREELGQINIVLPNKEMHRVALGADTDVFSKNDFLENILTTISENENIIRLIKGLAVVLALVVIINIIIFIIKQVILRRNSSIRH